MYDVALDLGRCRYKSLHEFKGKRADIHRRWVCSQRPQEALKVLEALCTLYTPSEDLDSRQDLCHKARSMIADQVHMLDAVVFHHGKVLKNQCCDGVWLHHSRVAQGAQSEAQPPKSEPATATVAAPWHLGISITTGAGGTVTLLMRIRILFAGCEGGDKLEPHNSTLCQGQRVRKRQLC